MNRTRLREQLIRHEGLRLKPYRCSAGKLTIGVGRNLDDKGLSAEEVARLGRSDLSDGITREEAMMLLDNDIDEVWQTLCAKMSGVFTALDEPRQHVLMDMCFNLGFDGLQRFRKMIAAVERRDLQAWHDEMLDSAWAGQVGQRSKNLAELVLS